MGPSCIMNSYNNYKLSFHRGCKSKTVGCSSMMVSKLETWVHYYKQVNHFYELNKVSLD